MSEPWVDPLLFGVMYGSIVGGGGGALIGIVGGIAGSVLVPRGIGRPWVLGGMAGVALLGVLSLGVGVIAVFAGQPYGIWFPLCLVGFIFAAVCGGLIPDIRRRYRLVEQRRIEAETIRSS